MFEVVGNAGDVQRIGVDAKHVAPALLGLGLIALIIAEDAVGGVGEPDTAIAMDYHVVGRVQAFAFILISQGGDAAIRFGAGDAARTVLAGHQPPLQVAGVAIGEIGGRTKHRNPLLRGPAQDALVGDVTPQQVAAVVEPHRAFCPAALVVEALKLGVGQGQAAKTLVVKLVDIIIHGSVLKGCAASCAR